MPLLKRTCLVGLSALAFACSARGSSLDDTAIPASAKWVIHVDVDAITKTPAWAQFEPKLNSRPEYARKKTEIERLFRVKLPADLHDVTLFGATATPQDAVVLIHANMNQADLKDLLSRSATFEEKTMDGHQVFSWDDNGQSRSGAFIGNDRLIVTESAQTIVDTLNVIAGKREGLKSGALLAGSKREPTTGLLLYVAGDQLATLAQQAGAKNQVVGQLDSAWIAVGADAKGLVLTSEVMAQKDEVAVNVAKSVEGIRAMLSFADPSDERAAALLEAMQPLTTKTEGKRVTIAWPVSNETVADLLEMLPENGGPKPQPK